MHSDRSLTSKLRPTSTTRRKLLSLGAASSAVAAFPGLGLAAQSAVQLPFGYGERDLVAFPEKKPLIVLTSRPPQLETPFALFDNKIITPNDEFFVRYHWAGVPTSVDPTTFRLKIGGDVQAPVEFSLQDLKTKFTAKKIVAVNQCSGNSRGFFEPRVNGGQSGNGNMGNAAWVGVPLKELLAKANPGKAAKQVTFNGLDTPVLGDGPDFIKALGIDHAMDGEVMVAYEMNGAELPMLNGFPIRLIVPGYYGTYWVKHLSEINVVDEVFNGFWMNPAYRIPDNECNCVEPGKAPEKTIPINKFKIRSFITNLTDKSVVTVGQPTLVRGIAFDAGQGITRVMFSQDGGKTWVETRLGEDLGKYSFRPWSLEFKPMQKGTLDLRVQAFNRAGETQPMTASWNPAGYMRNVVESITVQAV